MPKRVCIISLAMRIEVDPRTSRQVVYLAREYDVTLISFGNPPSDWTSVTWRPVDHTSSTLQRLLELLLLVLGRVFPPLYTLWFSLRPRYQQALRYALESKADVYHASDWATLAICAQAARQTGARVFFDADEYWPLENETSRAWRLFFSPLIADTLHRYAAEIDAASTVSQPISERYRAEYHFASIILLNVPDYEETPLRPIQPTAIKLMHHGAARRNRYLETMIEALAQTDARFSLHFMMVESDPGYLDELRHLAEKIAPGRVEFRPIVHPFEIVRTIADCDIGICLIPPTTYTYQMTLPNKLFEFFMAGMAVINGPSPAMADVVREYEAGWVLPSFSAADLAALIDSLTVDQIEAARAKAREAAKILNAETELNKLLELYQRLLNQSS